MAESESVVEQQPRKRKDLFQGDKVIWVIFFFLCAISIIEVYSAASSLTYKSGYFWDPIIRHATFLLLGAVVVWVFHNIPCRWFKFYPIITIPISILMLLIVLLMGAMTNGAARWTSIFGIPIQPSEIAKGAVVTAVALVLTAMQTEKGADRHAFKYILWIAIPICALIFPENLSTAGILFLVVLFMMFIGRVPLIQLGKLLGVMAIGLAAVVALVTITPKETLDKIPKMHRLSTWMSRLNTFSGSEETKKLAPEDFDTDKNAQAAHANIAIATSNLVGKFPGNSVERDFLSQAYSDFIYAIVIEEMGLVGGGFVILLYIILLFRASRIANRCERNFPAFLVLGLSLLLVTQAILNMMVATGLFPITGQPLPLISRGGSSTIINCVYIGMILSVSRFAKQRQPDSQVVADPVEEQFTSTEGLE